MGAIIQKPKMTDKLLAKPPFRFIHDVFSEVTRATGFAEGLYDETETDAKAIKDKASKMNYLQKMISFVSLHLGVVVEARPAKIVAGLDVEQTNVLLQYMAVAANSGNSSDAVSRVLNGEGGSSSDAPAAAEAKAPARTVPCQLQSIDFANNIISNEHDKVYESLARLPLAYPTVTSINLGGALLCCIRAFMLTLFLMSHVCTCYCYITCCSQ
jgi:hypothetical protein